MVVKAIFKEGKTKENKKYYYIEIPEICKKVFLNELEIKMLNLLENDPMPNFDIDEEKIF